MIVHLLLSSILVQKPGLGICSSVFCANCSHLSAKEQKSIHSWKRANWPHCSFVMGDGHSFVKSNGSDLLLGKKRGELWKTVKSIRKINFFEIANQSFFVSKSNLPMKKIKSLTSLFSKVRQERFAHGRSAWAIWSQLPFLKSHKSKLLKVV